jgi:integrase
MPEWTIGKHRGGLCLVYYRDGKRHRHALGTACSRKAAQVAPALYHDLTRPKTTTVGDLWRAYMDEMQGRAVVATMIHTWKALEPLFGGIEPDAITIQHCRSHTDRRRERGIKDGTIHTELGHLRMVLLWAVKHRLIANAPHIERPGKPKSGEKHLTRAQVKRLIAGCDLPHLKLFVHLGYATSARSAALLGLTWDRVDFERGKIDLRDPAIRIPHKGRAIVPMTRTLRAALTEAQSGAMSPYVIEWAGGRVGSVKKGLAAAAKRAGLAKVTPHMLRHSAAVRMAEDGVPMEEIASYLGHSNVNVTRTIYAKFSPEFLQGAAASLELDEIEEVKERKRV